MSHTREPEGNAPVNNTLLTPAQADEICGIVARFADVEGPTLPVLHAIHGAFGHIPRDAVPIVAERLNRSRAEIHGVVTFYHDFRSQPAGRHVVKVCRAEACQSMGGERVVAAFTEVLGIRMGDTTSDGGVTLEPVYCLGLCAVAPAAMVDGRVIGRLDAAKAVRLAGEVAPATVSA